MLGVIALQEGKMGRAIHFLRQAIRSRPDLVEAHNNLGIALRSHGQFDAALGCFREAVRLRPGFAQAHHHQGNVLRNLGNDLRNQGKLDEALVYHREAVRLAPGMAEGHISLGNTLNAHGKLDEAVNCYREALRLRPASAEAHNNLGNVLTAQGKLDDAVVCFQQAMRLSPAYAEAHNNLGNALREKGQLDEALACYDQAVRLKPDYADAHNNRGTVFFEQQKLAEAAACYREALRIKPSLAQAHVNLGNVIAAEGRLDEAVVSFHEALRLDAGSLEARCGLGNALKEQGRLAEAEACYNEVVRRKPDLVDGHWSRALLWLLQGDFERGWPEYEWRWRPKTLPRRPFPQPVWDGSPLEGRRILLRAEQGLGDTIQFVRYASQARECGGQVLLECPRQVHGLLARCPGVDFLVAAGSSLPEFHVHAPLLSLPGILGTTLANVPAPVPYLFGDPGLKQRWHERLREWEGVKIGIAWQGSTKYRGDRFRSIPLREFAPLARVRGVHLFSLQKGHGTEQLGDLPEGFVVTDLGKELDEQTGAFMETAAVMSNLDVVITSDTAIAHLAGALGVRVWVALAFMPDWRWLLGREDSPWYPTMRLFRQERRGDWRGVFERIATTLTVGRR